MHPTDRVITIYRLGPDNRFAPAEIVEGDGPVTVEAVPGLSVDFSLVYPPPPPEAVREPPSPPYVTATSAR